MAMTKAMVMKKIRATEMGGGGKREREREREEKERERACA